MSNEHGRRTSLVRLPSQDKQDRDPGKQKDRLPGPEAAEQRGARTQSAAFVGASSEKADSGTDSDTGERKRNGGVSLFAAMEMKMDRRMSDPGFVRKDKPSKPISALSKELPTPPSPESRSASSSPTAPRKDAPLVEPSAARTIPYPPSRPRPVASHSPSRPQIVASHSPPSASSIQSSPSYSFVPAPSAVKRSTSDDWSATQKIDPAAVSRRRGSGEQTHSQSPPQSKDERSRSASVSTSTTPPVVRAGPPVDKGNKIKAIWQNTKQLISGRISSDESRSRHRSRELSETESVGYALTSSSSSPPAAAGFSSVGSPHVIISPMSEIDEGESSGHDSSTPSDKSAMEDTIIHHDLILIPPMRKPGAWRSVDDSVIDKVVSDDPRYFFAAPLDPVLPESEDIPLDLDLSEFDIVYDKPLPPPPPGAAPFESYSRPLPPLPPPLPAAPAREGLFNSKNYTQTTRKASIKRSGAGDLFNMPLVSRSERRSAHLRRTASSDNIISLSSVQPLPDLKAQVQPAPGFRIEAPNAGGVNGSLRQPGADMPVEDPEPVYAQYFVGRRHVTYIGFNNYIGYVAVSLIKEPGGYLALLRTKEADQRVAIPSKGIRKPSDRKLLQLVNAFLSPDMLAKVPSHDVELVKTLCDFDDLKVAKLKRTNTYKIGVLYVREGQTQENDMFSNTSTSREFEDFLNLLGQRVVLQGFTRFNGGLDVEGYSTGRYSVYTQWENSELMFHVSTLIPLGEKGSEENMQIERKRHIGNDVVVVVFTDSTSAPFNPRVLGSHYNHVFIVVSVDRRMGPLRYRITVVQREGVPTFKPPLAFPPLYDRSSSTRDFILSKIVNGELAALYAPGFRSRIIASRQKLLQVLASKYPK